MFELVTYAASRAQLEEVVSCGADAVCLRFRPETARKSPGTFTRQELSSAVRYCHVRGVRVYASFESLYTDGELPALIDDFASVSAAGVDAVRLGDLGAALIAREIIPDIPLHAAPSICARAPGGTRLAASMGFSRTALGSCMTAESLCALQASTTEREVTGVGSGCAAVPGRCYLASFLSDAKAGNGPCAFPCRAPFWRGRHGFDYPLCANPVSLIGRLDALKSYGVTAVMLDTREIRPDLASGVVGAFYNALHDPLPPSPAIHSKIAAAYGSPTVGGGLFTGLDSTDFFAKEVPHLPGRAGTIPQKTPPELQRIDVRFSLRASAGTPINLAVKDRDGNVATAEGTLPQAAADGAAPEAALRTQLYRTGATPYRCTDVKLAIDRGLGVDPQELASLRDRTLLQLTAIRGATAPRRTGPFSFGVRIPPPEGSAKFTVELSSRAQLSGALAELKPARLYLPLGDIVISQEQLRPFQKGGNTEICAVLPQSPVFGDLDKLRAQLSVAHDLGIATALAGDPDSVALALSEGFKVRGDWGLNIRNSLALRAYGLCGLISATVSFDMTALQIGALSHELETEMLIYGRLPLLVTEQCVIKSLSGVCSCASGPVQLKDHRNVPYPLLKDTESCRNIVCDCKKLFPRSLNEFNTLGVGTLRLRFTAENARECADTTAAFLSGSLKAPNASTYGHYFKKERSLLSWLRRGPV